MLRDRFVPISLYSHHNTWLHNQSNLNRSQSSVPYHYTDNLLLLLHYQLALLLFPHTSNLVIFSQLNLTSIILSVKRKKMYEMYFSTIKSTDNSRAIEGLALLVGFVVSGVGAVIEPLRSECVSNISYNIR